MRPLRDPVGPGQESVWDYPRPPRLEACTRHLSVRLGGTVVAETRRGPRVLETSHAPVYYLPREDVRMDLLARTDRSTLCEYKGQATYFSVRVGAIERVDAAWSFERPTLGFEDIRSSLAFYASAFDECRVDGELVRPQAGGFYGGWITKDVAGPFKGEPGTRGW